MGIGRILAGEGNRGRNGGIGASEHSAIYPDPSEVKNAGMRICLSNSVPRSQMSPEKIQARFFLSFRVTVEYEWNVIGSGDENAEPTRTRELVSKGKVDIWVLMGRQ